MDKYQTMLSFFKGQKVYILYAFIYAKLYKMQTNL